MSFKGLCAGFGSSGITNTSLKAKAFVDEGIFIHSAFGTNDEWFHRCEERLRALRQEAERKMAPGQPWTPILKDFDTSLAEHWSDIQVTDCGGCETFYVMWKAGRPVVVPLLDPSCHNPFHRLVVAEANPNPPTPETIPVSEVGTQTETSDFPVGAGEEQGTAPSHRAPGYRPRPRARLTNVIADFVEQLAIENQNAEAVERVGTHKTSQGVRAWFKAVFKGAAKVESLHRVCLPSEEDDDGKMLSKAEYLIDLKFGGVPTGVMRVGLGLLAKLVVYMAFRQRTKDSYLQCRSKASQYAKELKYTPELLACVIHDTVTLAVNGGRAEWDAWRMQASEEGRDTQVLSAAYASGLANPAPRGRIPLWAFAGGWAYSSAVLSLVLGSASVALLPSAALVSGWTLASGALYVGLPRFVESRDRLFLPTRAA
jgi:hypothetical protein